jgi:aryl-alcohol dehydrogenase-like predicted oxidoreductase
MALAWSTCGLGTAPLGSDQSGPLWFGAQDHAVAVATIRAALDAGITWIDTAPFYGWGRAEAIVGEAIVGRRDEVMILTKCGTVRRPDGTWVEDGSPAAVRTDLEASLERLRTDHVDVLQLHDPDPSTPIEETVGAMSDLVDAGMVGAVGLSNHPVDAMERASRVVSLAVVQHQWSLLSHGPDAAAAADWCGATGARFLCWSPLASGFLTEEFDLASLAPDDLRRRLPWAEVSLEPLAREAVARAMSLEQYALAWSATRGHPIVGARSPEEVALLANVEPLTDVS